MRHSLFVVSSFQMENPSDDPREFQHAGAGDLGLDDMPPDMDDFLRLSNSSPHRDLPIYGNLYSIPTVPDESKTHGPPPSLVTSSSQ